MKSMQNIIQSLNVAERFNSEVLYSFIEFQKVIQRMGDDYIETDDCIITPYYVFDGKRMELYEYKLYIHLVNTPNFEKYFSWYIYLLSFFFIKSCILLLINTINLVFSFLPNLFKYLFALL